MTSILFSGATPLVIFILKATLVLASALVATFALRRGTAGERHLVWLAALVGVLALPVLARIPSLQIGVLPSRFFTQGELVPPATTLPPEMAAMLPPQPMTATVAQVPDGHVVVIAGAPSPAPSPFPTESADSTTQLPSLLQTIAIVWAAVAASLLGWLTFGAFQVRRIVRNGIELTSPDWTTPLCEVADRIDLEQPPRLVMSDRIEMAFACRALAPTIVLPAAAESWTDERRRAVLFHELAHVKRHDLVAHTLGRVACALYWFHPLVWTAAKQLRAESEKACDDLVLSCGAKPSEYAQHLLDMVTSVRNYGAPVMALPMARKREFEGRMLAILDPAVRRAAPGRLQAATVVATVGALSLGVAAAAPAAPVSQGAAGMATEMSGMPALAVVDTPPVSTSGARERVADSVRDARAEARALARAERVDSEDAMLTGHLSSADKRVLRSVDGMTRDIVNQTLRTMGLNGTMHAQVVDTARANLLIKVLATDTDAGVRRSAAWALNDLHTPAADDALIRALASDADASVREMAAWALAESMRDAAGNALANALLHDKNIRVRATSAWALGENDRTHQPDALLSAVSDAEPDVRFTAIWALGQSDLRRAPMPVINALSDNSARVREVAAWALGEIEDSSATGALTRALEKESEARPKTALLWALSNIGTVPTSAIESAMKSSDPELRRRAVAMLAGAGNAWPWPWPWPQPRPNP